jgi:putative FmdB family regulatory protein
MPIYEYACSSCGHRFDVRQSFADDPIASCPSCGAPVRRVLHPAGVIFKGSGWYKTDSRSSGSSTAAASDSGTGTGESKPSETTSDTKTESKPESKTASKKETVKAAADD